MDNADHIETLLARWLAGELNEEELAQLQQREDYADLKQIVEGLDGLAPPAFDENKAWSNLQAKRQASFPLSEGVRGSIQEPTHPKNIEEGQPAKAGGHRIIPMRRILSMAAAVLVLLAAGWWIFAGGSEKYDNSFATGTGEQMEFKLPDGSTVHLNSVSKLEYASADWLDKRTLHLAGEAHFRVKKGSTFTVLTDQGEVKVVGTIFNVNVRDGEMAVKCTHGKVQIISPREQKVIIKAGEQVRVENGVLQKRQGIDFTPKWFQGESIFKSTPVPKVFDELERQYGITVLHDDLSERMYTGKFKHDNLEGAIKRICPPMELECTLSGDTLRVQ